MWGLETFRSVGASSLLSRALCSEAACFLCSYVLRETGEYEVPLLCFTNVYLDVTYIHYVLSMYVLAHCFTHKMMMLTKKYEAISGCVCIQKKNCQLSIQTGNEHEDGQRGSPQVRAVSQRGRGNGCR